MSQQQHGAKILMRLRLLSSETRIKSLELENASLKTIREKMRIASKKKKDPLVKEG